MMFNFPAPAEPLGGNAMNIPDELLYSEYHLWVLKSAQGHRIGITEYAANELGAVDFIELPEPDDEIGAGETFGSVETSKAVTDLIAPVSGRVLDINTDLIDEPEILTSDPYNKGWLMSVEITDEMEWEELLDADKYGKYLAGLEE
jgi:glycine cleavage system H protein